VLPEPALTQSLARPADLPIEVGADWYVEAADE
jgi:hypothetical protein